MEMRIESGVWVRNIKRKYFLGNLSKSGGLGG
jgi:hypothetical protein